MKLMEYLLRDGMICGRTNLPFQYNNSS